MRMHTINRQFKNDPTHYLKLSQHLMLFKIIWVSLKQKLYFHTDSKIFLSFEDKNVYKEKVCEICIWKEIQR